MTEPRRVAVVTGTRAEFGLLASPMRALRDRADCELVTVVTGMHLSERHGRTIDRVRETFGVDRSVDALLASDTDRGMAKSLGYTVAGVTEALGDLAPDAVLVLGDRGEAFAGAIAAAHLSIPVGHVHGGETMTGATIDDSIRHAITKFAHLHFPATDRAADRVRQLGEADWRITACGAPGLDDVLAGRYAAPETIREELALADGPLTTVLQHPETTTGGDPAARMRRTLDAVCALPGEVVVIAPNADAGGERALAAIEAHEGAFHTIRNLPREQFLGLVAASDALVDNSSAGIIEAPSLDTPTVDVGDRQESRLRADSVHSVAHDTDAIRRAIRRCREPSVAREAAAAENPYARGGAGERIAERLATQPIDDRLRRKEWHDR